MRILTKFIKILIWLPIIILELIVTLFIEFPKKLVTLSFNKLENLSKKLNKVQKRIVAIIVPATLFVITVTIADKVGRCGAFYKGFKPTCGAFNWDKTWLIWIIFLLAVGYFEYKLFGNQNRNDE